MLETATFSKDYSTHVPPVASIWHRSLAFIIDVVILGIFGHVSSWLLWSLWFQLGPHGRWVGIPIVLLYFGIFNSGLQRGQTPGKRFVKLAVRGPDNQPINLGRSILRTAIVATPVTLLGWSLPVFETDLFQWLQLSLALGLGSVLGYTFIYNRTARQALHDLVCQTYVVNLEGRSIPVFPNSPNALWKVSGVLFLVSVTIAGLLSFLSLGTAATAETESLRTLLEMEERFFTAKVEDTQISANQPEAVHMLDINVWHKDYLGSEEEQIAVMDSIARTALANTTNIDEFDLLNVTITFTYDILIAQRTIRINHFQTIAAWQDRINSSNE